MSESIALPPARICVGITGHRDSNAAFAANQAEIGASLEHLFSTIDAVTARQSDAPGKTRLHALLASGADMVAVEKALDHDWDVTAPLPFGLDLNIAINADPGHSGHGPAEMVADEQAEHMRDVAKRVRLFELAEQDGHVRALLETKLAEPQNAKAAHDYLTTVADRVAAAGRVMIEQSDLVIAIWDGVTPGAVGGTRHTISVAVSLGTPVLWINAAKSGQIALIRIAEELFAHDHLAPLDQAGLEQVIEATLNPPDSDQNERAIRFHTEQWHKRSLRRFHAYRRIEALFGGSGFRERFGRLVQTYETPGQIAAGSSASMLAVANSLPGRDPGFAAKVESQILRRFAWADGLSTFLSDAYRGGMVTNFLLSAMAIMIGVAYLPLASVDAKWPFALGEFLLLTTILAITVVGQRKRWHGRWFETRRVAEYFRHAPIMLLLGVARASGRWPRSADTEWPEYYAREVLCEIGLPSVKIGQDYLRAALKDLLLDHATRQRVYHEQKSVRLTRTHHRLDHLSEWLFILAVLSVATYLTLIVLSALGLVPEALVNATSKSFTFLGVILPALGGAFAGIRYFGDFERFASISEITAEKLAAVGERIGVLLNAPDGSLRYAQVAELAHAIDDIVVSEIENWQSVFGGKQIAVPV
jgi:hypothetical protein